MGIPANIQLLYTPVQPSIRNADDNVLYREYAPHAQLTNIVYCYWQLKTTQPLNSEFIYRVVADGCIDVYFEPGNPPENYVMGFSSKYTEFSLGNSFHYVGIRFLPTMFPQLFRINAAELSNRYEALNAVVPGMSRFIQEHLHDQLAISDMVRMLDGWLLQLAGMVDFNADNRLYEAMDIILKKAGMVHLEHDIDTGISPRQLRRLFEYYIGDTPKTFSKIVRFQQILRAKPSVQSLRQNKLFFDAGYHDQAHFIKEFRHLYGITPTRAFDRE
ncbi:helix-turn-helix domain-containing protein [Chitinophaga filiformis]|uniref:AraC family transcriptional regulator n=1 Tax=Chitinophaga filiformis TaxID=104663 RepID=UPI001F3BA22D|nr:helix-turn-helix domain-containing protein [Chitinophaga filiformis]MCF6405050.1 helix-turn-helix domain-containing protein [Chitinophaga filiformis]